MGVTYIRAGNKASPVRASVCRKAWKAGMPEHAQGLETRPIGIQRYVN